MTNQQIKAEAERLWPISEEAFSFSNDFSRINQAIWVKACEWCLSQSEQEAVKIVTDLAEWSKKYPRQPIYAMHNQAKMDGELIAIEERAKEYIKSSEKGGKG